MIDKKELFTSMALAWNDFPEILKDSKGAHNAKYAKLPAFLDAVVPVLDKHGITFSQPTGIRDGFPVLITLLYHRKSGQYIESVFPLTLDESNVGSKSRVQVEGGTQTYHRRYQIMTLLGICGEDDDSDGNFQKPSYQSSSSTPSESKPGTVSPKQAGFLLAKINGRADLLKDLLENFAIEKLIDLPWKKMDEALEFIACQ